MKKTATLLVAAILPAISGTALAIDSEASEGATRAPVSDRVYCHALTDALRTWGTGSGVGGLPVGNATAVAIAQCQEGEPGQAIPVLEQELRDRDIKLPPRN
ncbi:MAG: hypothetical protein JO339_36980 [Alphaproteobacteria bacterium]|nr:hypothetical protein [Alphaproteobacteria bacterium]